MTAGDTVYGMPRWQWDAYGTGSPERVLAHRPEPVEKGGVVSCGRCGRAVRTVADGRFPVHARVG